MTHHDEKDDYVAAEAIDGSETGTDAAHETPGSYTGSVQTEGEGDLVFPVDHGAGEENDTDPAGEKGTGYVTATDPGDGA